MNESPFWSSSKTHGRLWLTPGDDGRRQVGVYEEKYKMQGKMGILPARGGRLRGKVNSRGDTENGLSWEKHKFSALERRGETKWTQHGEAKYTQVLGCTLWALKQEALGRTNCLLSLIQQGPHWKRRVQQFFYCYVRIRYRGNFSTEPLPNTDRGIFTKPLPSNDKGIFTEPLPTNDKGTFTEQLPSNDKVTITQPLPSNDRGDTQTHTQTTWSHKTTSIFSK
jgi:hypothetical protein